MWAELPEDVLRELMDIKYEKRTHGKKSTSSAGCRGPLCRKAERDIKQEQRRVWAEASGKETKTYRRSMERIMLDTELNRIIAWHWLIRSEPVNSDEELTHAGPRERRAS